VASVIFHGLFLAPIILAATSHKTRIPNQQGAGASAIISSQEPVMTLIFIKDTAVSEEHEESDEEIASRGMAPAKFLVSIASPDPTPGWVIAILKSTRTRRPQTRRLSETNPGTP
jgi:hypothetical protein